MDWIKHHSHIITISTNGVGIIFNINVLMIETKISSKIITSAVWMLFLIAFDFIFVLRPRNIVIIELIIFNGWICSAYRVHQSGSLSKRDFSFFVIYAKAKHTHFVGLLCAHTLLNIQTDRSICVESFEGYIN